LAKIFKIAITSISVYVFITRIYIIWYYFSVRNFDISILLCNFIVLGSCVLLSLVIWNRIIKIRRYKALLIIPLFLNVFFHLFWGLFDFLARNPNVNHKKILWVFDVPNFLSIFVMVFLMILILKKK